MTTSINNFFGKSIPYLLLANVFFIPINIKIAIPFIIVIAFAWLLSGDWLEIASNLRNNAVVILLLSFWAIHVLGMIHTKNIYYGMVDIQHKLSFIVFPLFFLSSAHRIIPYKRWFLTVFVAGCVASGAYMLINALTLSITVDNGSIVFNTAPKDAWWENYFWYNRLSVFHHTSYLAMYFAFSIAILFSFIREKMNGKSLVINGILIAFFYALIILLSSKAGILVGTLTIVAGIFWLLFKKYRTITVLASLALLLVSGYLFVQYNWRFVKLNDNIEAIVADDVNGEKSIEKTDMRIQIWSSIPKTLGKNWIFGFGTGDSKDELVEGYSNIGMKKAYEEQLNAHNQYLETLLALGIGGLVLLMILLFYPIYKLLRVSTAFLPIMFLGILAINLLFESMLVRIAGVMFFSIFYCLFFINKPNKNKTFY